MIKLEVCSEIMWREEAEVNEHVQRICALVQNTVFRGLEAEMSETDTLRLSVWLSNTDQGWEKICVLIMGGLTL